MLSPSVATGGGLQDIPEYPYIQFESETGKVVSGVLNDEADLPVVENVLRAEIEATQAQNPAVRLTVVEALSDQSSGESDPLYQRFKNEIVGKVAGGAKRTRSRFPFGFVKGVAKRMGKSVRSLGHRVTFAFVRGGTNGSVSAWSLIVSPDIPAPAAIGVGMVTGMLSGGLQFYNGLLQSWLVKGTILKKVFGLSDERIAKFALNPEELARWYTAEVAFVTVIEATMALMGIHRDGTLLDAAGGVLVTASLSFAGQAGFDLANSIWRGRRVAQGDPNAQKRSDLVAMAISALSVAGAVASLSGLPVGKITLVSMAVGGWPTYLIVRSGLSFQEIRKKVLDWLQACDRFLSLRQPHRLRYSSYS